MPGSAIGKSHGWHHVCIPLALGEANFIICGAFENRSCLAWENRSTVTAVPERAEALSKMNPPLLAKNSPPGPNICVGALSRVSQVGVCLPEMTR